MITAQEVRDLIERERKPGGRVLSVYLNVDRSHAVNLNRGFEPALKTLLRTLEENVQDRGERKRLAAAAEEVLRAVAQCEPRGRTLVILRESTGQLLWQREVSIGLANCVRWTPQPYLRPLIEALDASPRYGVVLTDKSQARLFTVFLNEVQEHLGAFTVDEVQHVKGTGKDHVRSQMQVQRKADVHVLWHLKHVAGLLEHLAGSHGFIHLILAGPVAATKELQHLLSERLRRCVVGHVPLPMEASAQQVLDSTLALHREVRKTQEEASVQELLTAAAKSNQAVTGLEQTLLSLREGRVWRIVYCDGYSPRGGECAQCETLFGPDTETCPYCGGGLQKLDDVVARAVDGVVNSGGKTEPVHGEAAQQLQAAGGVGAFLRF